MYRALSEGHQVETIDKGGGQTAAGCWSTGECAASIGSSVPGVGEFPRSVNSLQAGTIQRIAEHAVP